MRDKMGLWATLCCGLFLMVSCQNEPSQSKEPAILSNHKEISIQVNNQGEITLNGSSVALEELASKVSELLKEQDIIPAEIPVEYDDQVLMGTRAELRTELGHAMEMAQKPVLDVLIPAVEAELKIPVSLDEVYLNAEDGYAFVSANALNPDGSELDFSKTSHKSDFEAGVYSNSVFGLLQKENGQWKIITTSIGATDVPFMCWWKEFKVPQTVFGKDRYAEDCE